MKHSIAIPASLAVLALLNACHNGNNEFDDFDTQTVYFANQYAMRTVELGTDEFVDLTADNNHEVYIKAAWGGGYNNNNNVFIDYVIDPTLVDGFYFKDTDILVETMPSEYYVIEDERIKIPSGSISGGLKVKLTEEFFADPKSVTTCYVIPVRMTEVTGADRILTGTAAEENPVLTNDAHWSVQPKNFVLYGVKFVNPWHGEYLRRGVDKVTVDGTTTETERKSEYVENDETVEVTTSAYKEDLLPVKIKDASGNDHTVNLLLTFSDDNTCVVSSATDGAEVSGTGRFVVKGEKNSLGGKDRDAIYLDYTITLANLGMKVETSDILVLHTRNVYGAQAFSIERK